MEKNVIVEVFKDCLSSEEEMKQVVDAFESVFFKKKAYLFRPNELINHYFFIENGFARSFVIDREGNEITTQFFSTSEIVIDWPAFFRRTSTQEYYQAMQDMKAWKISADKFNMLFETISGFRESGRSRLIESFYLIKKRYLDLIMMSAKNRYLTLMKQHPEILENASLKDIATYLGITDTSLSRIRKELTA